MEMFYDYDLVGVMWLHVCKNPQNESLRKGVNFTCIQMLPQEVRQSVKW